MIVPAYLPIRTPRSKNMLLEDGFQPGDHDVICGRGKQSYHHPGNRRFRLAIFMYMDRYQRALTKLDKSLVVISIVDSIRNTSGGFVKRNAKQKGQWIEIGDQLAREKVGHALRDAISARGAEGKEPEGGRFAQVVSPAELMKMTAKELEHTEKQLKTGRYVTCSPTGIASSNAENVLKTVDHAVKIVSFDSGERQQNAPIHREVADALPHVPAIPKRRSFAVLAREESDDFSPIKLEDLHKIDLSLLTTFISQIARSAAPAPSSAPDMTIDQQEDEEQDFAAFVMDTLSEDEGTSPQEPAFASRRRVTLEQPKLVAQDSFHRFVTETLMEVDHKVTPVRDVKPQLCAARRVSADYAEV